MTRMKAPTRRELALAGCAGAALLATGLAARAEAASDLPNDGEAYAPWRDWTAAAAGPRHLIHAAILAANAHDTQPWRFCAAADRIELFADESRNLGAMDPFRREMQISLGCAVENLAIAARAQGFSARVVVDPGSVGPATGARHAATIMLDPATPDISPLLAAIPRRHTNRGPYDGDRPVPAEAIERFRALAGADDSIRLILLTEPAARQSFAGATVAATQAIISDERMIADSDAWFRASDAEIAAHRDGPTLYAAGLSPLTLLLARLFPVSPERGHRGWLDQTRDVQVATAPLFGLIAVRDLYDREQAIRAGRLWQRLHLQATLLGLGMQPLNQLPEMVDREAQLGKPAATAATLAGLAGDAAWRPTFAFRAGWPERPAPASPRRAVEAVMRPDGCGV
jgi:nitroreductase